MPETGYFSLGGVFFTEFTKAGEGPHKTPNFRNSTAPGGPVERPSQISYSLTYSKQIEQAQVPCFNLTPHFLPNAISFPHVNPSGFCRHKPVYIVTTLLAYPAP